MDKNTLTIDTLAGPVPPAAIDPATTQGSDRVHLMELQAISAQIRETSLAAMAFERAWAFNWLGMATNEEVNERDETLVESREKLRAMLAAYCPYWTHHPRPEEPGPVGETLAPHEGAWTSAANQDAVAPPQE